MNENWTRKGVAPKKDSKNPAIPLDDSQEKQIKATNEQNMEPEITIKDLYDMLNNQSRTENFMKERKLNE